MNFSFLRSRKLSGPKLREKPQTNLRSKEKEKMATYIIISPGGGVNVCKAGSQNRALKRVARALRKAGHTDVRIELHSVVSVFSSGGDRVMSFKVQRAWSFTHVAKDFYRAK